MGCPPGQTVPQAATLQVDMATKFAIIVANSDTYLIFLAIIS